MSDIVNIFRRVYHTQWAQRRYVRFWRKRVRCRGISPSIRPRSIRPSEARKCPLCP